MLIGFARDAEAAVNGFHDNAGICRQALPACCHEGADGTCHENARSMASGIKERMAALEAQKVDAIASFVKLLGFADMDALFNLATSYTGRDMSDEALEVYFKLVEVDLDGVFARRNNLYNNIGSTFSGSVVANMNFAWSGGSSRVFKRALKASLVSMWTSSMM